MMEERQTSPYAGVPQSLPNATATLVLGILSIIGCCFYGLPGLALGIIAIVMANRDLRLYRQSPATYTVTSYNNTKTGKTCAVISIVLSSLYIVFVIALILLVGVAALSSPAAMQHAIQSLQH